MRITRPSAARLAAIIGVPAALLASGVLVSTASYSAFVADTGNAADSWSSGSVALSDDDSGSALFSVTGLKPGASGSNCIKVTSTGSLPSTVKVFATGPATANALATAITLTVEQGTGGGFGSCSGFTADSSGGTVYSGTLAAFAPATSGWSTASGSWTTTGAASESKVYRISWSLPSNASSSAQGLTTTATFTWEAQNT